MSLVPLKARQIERRSLHIGVCASAFMAVAGVCVHVLSGSNALLLDGLYSAVMVRSPDRPIPMATTVKKRCTSSSAPSC